jgi:membrane glycosyltransferase
MDDVRMFLRRVAVASCGIAVALAELAWLRAILERIGWGPATLALMVCGVAVAPWLGLCAVNAVAGFLVRMLVRDPPASMLPGMWSDDDRVTTPTAILVAVRAEALGPILENLELLLAGLDASRWGDKFAAFVLSDTPDGEAAEAERLAVAAHPRIGYRRREHNAGYKAGNILSFLDALEGFEFAVVLDADSVMTADAVLRLVRILQARRDIAIVQHLTVGLPAASPFPRLFQFGMRAGMRIWATGQAWWQGDAGPYWGHNAALRVAPFREHARLPALPDGSAILSHDQVEAALLRAAHWGVWVWPDSRGSYEANPPDILEFERRDARWQRGNWQYRHLILRPGLLLMGRWQLLQAMLLFAGAPFYVAMACLAAWLASRGAAAPGAAALLYVWALTIYSPKLLSYAEVLLRPRARARYGGAGALWRAIAAETIFTLVLDAIAPVSKTIAFISGGRGWTPQRRDARRLGLAEAALRFLPHTALGLLLCWGFARAGWGALAVAPFIAGLPLAIPFAALTASPEVGQFLARRGIAASPEELAGKL